MKTKAELVKEIAALKQQLAEEKKRPTGSTISNCTINMENKDKQAVAEAVKEGMKALQLLYDNNQNSYGIYLASDR